MGSMRRFVLAIVLGAPLFAACATERPEYLQREDEACFSNRTFSEEIPPIHWGDPVHDPAGATAVGAGGCHDRGTVIAAGAGRRA